MLFLSAVCCSLPPVETARYLLLPLLMLFLLVVLH